MGVDDLRRYLAASGAPGGGKDAEQIVDRVLQDRNRTPRFGRPALTIDDFRHLLFSEEAQPANPAPPGHNSYLTGNQLSSDCSDLPIIKALQLGVRVIELDIWPNSSKDDIDVLHGRNGDDLLYGGKSSEDGDENKTCKHKAPEYKHLITTIKAGKPKGAIVDALNSDPEKVRRLSLSEQELAKVAASHGPNIVRFTHRNLLRIYPKGTRFDSSNYNPFLGWVHGAQMVAFNMQGYGRALWLMHGFYKANGGCGYVKKPEFLMQTCPDGKVFDPKADLPVKATLKVKVYMGDGWQKDFEQTHFDTYSPPDFYTKVGIAGVPSDSVMMKTKAVEDSWVPVWEEEFVFPLTVPEIAVLRVEVHEQDVSDDDFGGQTALPVMELRPGIRAVPLFDQKGLKFRNVKLLMGFEFV
ncbi:hypothetical protein PR202_gb19496 [Eleusine coracana subsp. coracana]|uniref:Phosphoinositide phospholipase C n=1 Tax=Eleusine coracana subsp. coracana TaxID=191504 RepID=A0AAV5F8E4_ELECO|nr:hypothetical protein PR202_gb19496 [Eleusine coracana subsp. coracana]